MAEIKIDGYGCEKCKHEWFPRVRKKKPKTCPKCKAKKIKIVKVKGYRCERCSYEWSPKKKDFEPVVCPSCHSPYFNRPKNERTKKTQEM